MIGFPKYNAALFKKLEVANEIKFNKKALEQYKELGLDANVSIVFS